MTDKTLCEHGVTPPDPNRQPVAMAAPFSHCGCCGLLFFYIDSGIYTMTGTKTETWTKDRCRECGGHYVTYATGEFARADDAQD